MTETKGYAEEMAEVFAAHRDEESLEGLRWDFSNLPAEEAVRELEQAEKILQGFCGAAEEISLPLLVLLGDAQGRAREARAVAKKYAEN
jgi:hypothetical protein